jgi:hypothetical protein
MSSLNCPACGLRVRPDAINCPLCRARVSAPNYRRAIMWSALVTEYVILAVLSLHK